MKRSKEKAPLLIALFGGITVIVVKLMNPELTETQVFLEFWWIWTGIIVAGILAFFLQVASEKDDG